MKYSQEKWAHLALRTHVWDANLFKLLPNFENVQQARELMPVIVLQDPVLEFACLYLPSVFTFLLGLPLKTVQNACLILVSDYEGSDLGSRRLPGYH